MSAQLLTQGATPTQEPELDMKDLTGALDRLTKSVANSLGKGEGVSIANSGTMSVGQSQGGGQGSMSDAGSIDDLQISKMTAAGVDAATIAGFRQYMFDKKKKKDEEAAAGGGASVPQPPFQRSEPAGSLAKSLEADDVIQDGVDVSPFLSQLVSQVAKFCDGLEKSVTRAQGAQDAFNQNLAAAVVESAKLLKGQARVIHALNTRLGLVERAPIAQPRGRTSGATALNKSMPGEAGAPDMQLRKSEICSTLSYMNIEKGIRQINGVPTSHLLGLYEGGNVLDENTFEEVKRFLQQNPNESQRARSYQ